ncbi:uncharacterized protein LOC129289668 [Prosopis cineraria]|uniref:uncharacterized protein LOC129289668 n=1 Tax=Prosopis cineraria TaxID=364024 RepID=UPI00240F18C0|nr:uncharacterized protein LOC129289668 [Prosopis cineraria]
MKSVGIKGRLERGSDIILEVEFEGRPMCPSTRDDERKRKINECENLVNGTLDGNEDNGADNKRLKTAHSGDPQNKSLPSSPGSITSSVHDGQSPPSIKSKDSSKSLALCANSSSSLSFSPDETGVTYLINEAHRESIVKRRLKDLCRIEKPTISEGIEMVGAVYLLKRTSSSSDDSKSETAMEQAVEAAKVLFDAEYIINKGLKLLSESQKSFSEAL